MSFVHGYWLFVSTSALVVIGGLLYVGYWKKRSIIFWRTAKLFSAILGLVGVVLFLFNFNKSVYSEFYIFRYSDGEGSSLGNQVQDC